MAVSRLRYLVLLLSLFAVLPLLSFTAFADPGAASASLEASESSEGGIEDTSDTGDDSLGDSGVDAPVLAAQSVAGTVGYYFVANSAFGNHLVFYFDANYATNSILVDSEGYLWNNTQDSIYLYCPDYPTYTVYAPRFSPFQYRTNYSGSYAYANLSLTDFGSLSPMESQGGSFRADIVLVFLVALCDFFLMFSVIRRSHNG